MLAPLRPRCRAGSLLRVDRKTIDDAAQRGLIPHRRLGRRLLFEREAVLAWLRQRDVDTT